MLDEYGCNGFSVVHYSHVGVVSRNVSFFSVVYCFLYILIILYVSFGDLLGFYIVVIVVGGFCFIFAQFPVNLSAFCRGFKETHKNKGTHHPKVL